MANKIFAVLPALAGLAAMFLIVYGVYLINHPAAWITGGVLLLLALLDSRQ